MFLKNFHVSKYFHISKIFLAAAASAPCAGSEEESLRGDGGRRGQEAYRIRTLGPRDTNKRKYFD